MKLLLARVDDRLIHGQVVVGCCQPLSPERLILCDDTVAADAFTRSLYAAAVPEELEAEFLSVDATVERLAELQIAGQSAGTILVVGSCSVMAALAEAGAVIETVTIGGAHAKPQTRNIHADFYLSDDEAMALQSLLQRGVEVRFQAVPNATLHELDESALADFLAGGNP